MLRVEEWQLLSMLTQNSLLSQIFNASTKMAGAMASSAKTLKDVNQIVSPGKVMESMRDFDRENTKMEMKSEIST